MGRIKQSRLNSSRMRTARRALGTADLPPARYEPGTRFIERHPPEVAKSLRAEAKRQRELLDARLAVEREEMRREGLSKPQEGLHGVVRPPDAQE